MRIKEELNWVSQQFISGSRLMDALIEQEQVSPAQAAGWLLRRIEDLDELTMYKFKHEIVDFEVVDVPFAYEVLDNIRSENKVDVDWSEGDLGYVGGWLKEDLGRFFAATDVPMPNIESDLLAVDATHVRGLPLVHDAGDVSDGSEPDALGVERPLHTKERTTLLCVIGTLAREAKFDISRPTKAAEVLVHSAALIGVRLGQRTVEEALKQVPDALDKRSS